MGDSALSSAQALEALEKLLAGDLSGAAVLKVSRASLGRLAVASRAARFKDLTALAGEAAPSAVDSGEIDRWLAELDDAGLAAVLTDLLRTEAATILRLPADKVDAAQPLQELGFDSLMGVELISAVEARFGVAIPVVAVSEIGTLEQLAARLVRELRREHPAAADAADAIGTQARRLAAQHRLGTERGRSRGHRRRAVQQRDSGARDPVDPVSPMRTGAAAACTVWASSSRNGSCARSSSAHAAPPRGVQAQNGRSGNR